MTHHLSTGIDPKKIRACAHGILLLLPLLFVQTAFLHAQAERTGTVRPCTPSFLFKDGWWGADAAYSIPLADGRSVWIFGDTLYGQERAVNGNDPRMVRNTIGVSRCDDQGQWSL